MVILLLFSPKQEIKVRADHVRVKCFYNCMIRISLH